MNKELIQQLLDDDETREQIADAFGQLVDDAFDSAEVYDNIMLAALNILKAEMITIEVSPYMWVRGEYLGTSPNGRISVSIPEKNPQSCAPNEEIYVGKRIKLERSEMSE